MRTLFKHEFRLHLHSSVSYAVTGLFLMITAVYYTLNNMRGRNSDLSGLYSTFCTLFMFIVPILTSRIIAEDRRSGVEILIFTSPSGITKIVIGKFLAVFTLIAIMLSVTLIFPLILLIYTKLHLLPLLGYYVGLLLLCAGISAFGILASALTENQVTAAIGCFVALLLLFIMRPISAALGGTVAIVLNYLSPFARYDEFGRGVFSFQGVIYFLSFIFLFLFLTVCVLSVIRQRGSVKGRTYAWISTVSIIAIVLLINLIFQFFPLKLDFSEGKRYSLSEATKELISSIDRDITIYGLFDEGKTDRDYLEVCELLNSYIAKSNGHIHVKYVDPDRDNQIISRLDPDGLINLRKNDYYVTDGIQGKQLKYQDLFRMEYDQRTSTWFNTGSTAERAFSDAIRSLTSGADICHVYVGNDYTLFSSGEDTGLPEFHNSYFELLLEVPESTVIPLEFYGLYFPIARDFDLPSGGTPIVISPGGKPLAAAWEADGHRNVLVGSSDFLNENLNTGHPAYFATNQYFENSVRDWVSAGGATESIKAVDYNTGELQIPRIKADFSGFLTIIVLPFGIFGRGFIVWRRRRHM